MADPRFIALQFDLDSIVVNVLEPRLAEGKLTPAGMAEVRGFLAKSRGPYLHGLDKIAIVFYHELDGVNADMNRQYVALQEKSTKRIFEQIKPVARFYIHRTGADLGRFKKMGKWSPDTAGLIEKTFFPMHCPGFNTVFILPTGEFYLKKGGYPYFFLGMGLPEN